MEILLIIGILVIFVAGYYLIWEYMTTPKEKVAMLKSYVKQEIELSPYARIDVLEAEVRRLKHQIAALTDVPLSKVTNNLYIKGKKLKMKK